jgi:hypothetical protein
MKTNTSRRQHKSYLHQDSGSALLTALIMSVFVCLMITMSAIWVQTRANQVMRSSNKMDHRIVLDGLFAYTTNGIKQSWCFSTTWVQDNACDLFHPRNTVRLLLSDETLMFLAVSNMKHPEPITATRLQSMTQTVIINNLTQSHPLYNIVKPTKGNYSTVTFTVKRDDSAVSTMKGREVPVRLNIKLTAIPGGKHEDLELESKLIVYPRELSYFGLIVPNDLYLGPSTPPNQGKGDVAFGSIPVSGTAGLRFESPIFVNGSVHLPNKATNAAQAMNNVIFLDKIVLAGGLVYEGTGDTLFSPPDAGGANNMYNHELNSFSGLLGGYELDPKRDLGLDHLFNLNKPPNLDDFDLCRQRVMASFDLSITKDSQLFNKFVASPGPNQFNLGLSLGNVDNLIEQYPAVSGATNEIFTNVPGVTLAGRVVSWDGGAVFRAKMIFEGLANPTTGKNEVFFNSFYLPRSGQVQLFPTGAGGSTITITTKPHVVTGNPQYNEVDMSVTFDNVGAFNMASYLAGSVFVPNAVKLILEGMDYGYNYAQTTRPPNDFSVTNKFMGPYKLNGFIFYKTPAGDMDIQRQSMGAWYNNPMMVDDEATMKTYAPLEKPKDERDWFAFDARCMTVPGNKDVYYMSFPSADWSVSFVDQSRHAWSFDPSFPKGYYNGTKIFDGNNSYFNGVHTAAMPATLSGFQISSLIKECSIEAGANFVTGFYGCEKLTIKARNTPLRIIGTIIAGEIDINPAAYRAGIRWSTIYHPQAVYELRNASILGRDKASTDLVCNDPSLPPLWQSNLGAVSVLKHYNCNPVSLRKADPFKWTTVDPDCGVPPNDVKISCKRATTRFLIKEVGRTKGL